MILAFKWFVLLDCHRMTDACAILDWGVLEDKHNYIYGCIESDVWKAVGHYPGITCNYPYA